LTRSDICDTINIESVGGDRYFLTFTDDYSRNMEIIMLHNKSDALQIFKNYKRKVENLTGKRIKKLRTNNDKEYRSKEFRIEGRRYNASIDSRVYPSTKQNSIAEQANRTLVKMARLLCYRQTFQHQCWRRH